MDVYIVSARTGAGEGRTSGDATKRRQYGGRSNADDVF